MAPRLPGDPSTHADTASGDTQSSTEPFDRTSQPLHVSGYELGEVIGRGGMGEVIAATDVQMERAVAIKRMRGTVTSVEATERFLREAKIQARLDHPAIVPVHELGRDSEGRPYFTMKRLSGTTLLDRLRERPEPALQPLLRAFVDVCFAIELAHQRGIVHRDLKPANIMLGDYNEVYVLDWGVARVLQVERTSSLSIDSDVRPGMTEAGAMLGTPGYMAPEQMRGDDVRPSADIYALGAILFELLAGKPLHPVGQHAIASTLATPTLAPSSRGRSVPPELDALCVEALAEDPAQRPSARQLADRVQRYLDGDRDAEQRRGIAARELAVAREALASGDPARRRSAAESAARALAFDPTSREAADLVARIIIEPPSDDPPELRESLARADAELNRKRSQRSIFAFLAIALWLPFVFFVEVTSWSALIALYASCLSMAALVWYNSRTAKVPLSLLLVGNLITVVAFSRLASPLVITPSVVCGMLLALASHHGVQQRPWVLSLWAVAALGGPMLLEALGVLAPTWRLAPEGVVTWGTIERSHGALDLASLVFGQTALVVVVAVYATSFSRAATTAQRAAHRQAWHLQQMIPRARS